MTREEKIKEIVKCLKRLGPQVISTVDLEQMPEDQLDDLVNSLKKLLNKFELD